MPPRPSTGDMEVNAFHIARDMLLSAEADFLRATKDVKGINAASKAIEKLRKISASKCLQNEDSSGVDALIETSEETFERSLRTFGSPASPSATIVDFNSWAHELQEAARYHDPLLLSFDDEEEEDAYGFDYPSAGDIGTKSGISLTSSKMLMKMTPRGKHHDETFRYLEGTSERQARRFNTITIAAWMFAVCCMILALGFLTVEFATSQKNPAIRIEQVPSKNIELPAISVCNNIQGLPAFENFPTEEYPGHPLFLIAALANEHDDDFPNLHYPDTISSDMIESIYRGPSVEKCKRDLSTMSIERSRLALFKYKSPKNETVIGFPVDEEPCQMCFRFGSKSKFQLSASGVRSPTEMPVIASVASSAVYEMCNLIHGKRNHVLTHYFSSEMPKHIPQLEEKGIITFKNPSLSEAEKALAFNRFNQYSVPDYQKMLCNVYFFAGHFYPSEDEGKVTWEWDEKTERWEDKGERAFSFETGGDDDGGAIAIFSANATTQYDTFMGVGLDLFYEDPKKIAESRAPLLVNRLSGDSFIVGPSTSYIYITRTDRGNGKTSFTVDADTSQIADSLLSIDRYMRLNLGKAHDCQKWKVLYQSRYAHFSMFFD